MRGGWGGGALAYLRQRAASPLRLTVGRRSSAVRRTRHVLSGDRGRQGPSHRKNANLSWTNRHAATGAHAPPKAAVAVSPAAPWENRRRSCARAGLASLVCGYGCVSESVLFGRLAPFRLVFRCKKSRRLVQLVTCRCQRSTRKSILYCCSEAPMRSASRRAATNRKSERRFRKTPITSSP